MSAPSEMAASRLAALARAAEAAALLAAPGCGVLAADESPGTLEKRFASAGLPAPEGPAAEAAAEAAASRRAAWRRAALGDAAALRAAGVSGVILHEETLGQCDAAGVPLVARLAEAGVLPGIKVDAGVRPLDPLGDPAHEGETLTVGLDVLPGKLEVAAAAGCRFAKWRAALATPPSAMALRANAAALARYAACCQGAGVCPIVEPELLMEGAHSPEEAAEAMERTVAAVVSALHAEGVAMECVVLKPAFAAAGRQYEVPAADRVARLTLRALQRTLPPAAPAVLFLSGGLPDEAATEYLRATARLSGPRPWALSFSFGRGLQAAALKAWAGAGGGQLGGGGEAADEAAAAAAARAALVARVEACSQAALGKPSC